MHRAAMTEVRLINWLKSGRGQGFGKDYRPFLQITRQDHASHGHSHIIPNQFIGRQHHLLSDLERKTGVLNLAQSVVKDFREQYPQWPCFHESPLASLYGHLGLNWSGAHPANSEGTLAIAKSMSVRHANFVGLQIPYVYSTDQLLTLQIKGRPPTLAAICVKYRSELRPKKVRAKMFRKLRLEREYWRRLGIPWLLVTEREINAQVYQNLEWALSGVIQRIQPGDLALLNRFVLAFGGAEWGGRCLDQMELVSKALDINLCTTIRMLKLAIWRALIPVDLTQLIDLQRPLIKKGFPRTAIDAWSPLAKLERAL